MSGELRPGIVALVAGIGRGIRGRTHELGGILAGTVRLVRRQPLRWLALGSIVGLPYAGVVFVDVLTGVSSVLASYLLDLLWPAALALELTMAASAAASALGGTPFRLRAAVSAALERTPPGLVVGVFVLNVYTYHLPTAALTVSCAAALAMGSWVLPAHVEQTGGLTSSVRRTIALSRGDRLPVAVAVSVLAVVAFTAAPLATSVLLPALGRAWSGNGWLLGEIVARYLGFVVVAVLAPLPAIAAAVAHVELKRRADGRHLARVFE